MTCQKGYRWRALALCLVSLDLVGCSEKIDLVTDAGPEDAQTTAVDAGKSADLFANAFFTDVWLDPNSDFAIAVGADGLVASSLSGDEWEILDFPIATSLWKVHGCSPDNIWAMSSQSFFHFDGKDWSLTNMSPGANREPDIFCSPSFGLITSSDQFDGGMLRFDNGAWSRHLEDQTFKDVSADEELIYGLLTSKVLITDLAAADSFRFIELPWRALKIRPAKDGFVIVSSDSPKQVSHFKDSSFLTLSLPIMSQSGKVADACDFAYSSGRGQFVILDCESDRAISGLGSWHEFILDDSRTFVALDINDVGGVFVGSGKPLRIPWE